MKFDTFYKIMVNEALTDAGVLGEPEQEIVDIPAILSMKYKPTELFNARDILEKSLDLSNLGLTKSEINQYVKVAIGMGVIQELESGNITPSMALSKLENAIESHQNLSKVETVETSKGLTSHGADPMGEEERIRPEDARQYGINPEIDENDYESDDMELEQ